MAELDAGTLARLAKFLDEHPEVAKQVAEPPPAPKPYTLYDVVRDVAARLGLLGGPDVALAEKVAAAIDDHEAAYPAHAGAAARVAADAAELAREVI